MQRDAGLKKVMQVAIVCRDIEATAERWAELLGVETPTISITDPGNQAGMIYQGRLSNAQCKLAFFHLGQCDLELIQPLGPGSSWQDGLDQHGEAVHHIAFTVSDLEGTIKLFGERGMPVIHKGHWDGRKGTYAYVDSQQQLGVMVELLNQK